MKRYIKGLYMALGMFCAIPLPCRVWDASCMSLMLSCFPIIGILIGLIWWGLAELLVLSGIHSVLIAAILTVIPFLLTGFLHLDGYMDTSDAIFSRRPLDEKLRILKDSHSGAFAVSMAFVLFTLQFASVYAVIDLGQKLTPLIVIPVISRCCAAIALLSLNALPQSNYANMFKCNTNAAHKLFVIMLALLVIAAAYLIGGLIGLVVVMLVVGGFITAMTYSYNKLKGVSGDLAGFSLVISELCGLIALGVIRWF